MSLAGIHGAPGIPVQVAACLSARQPIPVINESLDPEVATRSSALWRRIQGFAQRVEYDLDPSCPPTVQNKQLPLVASARYASSLGHTVSVNSSLNRYGVPSIHANQIEWFADATPTRQPVPMDCIVGQSPSEWSQCRDFLNASVKLKRGVFQAVSPLAHIGKSTKDIPIIDQLVKAWNQAQVRGEPLSLGDGMVVESCQEIRDFDALCLDDHRPCARGIALTVRNSHGDVTVIPITQWALPFEGALLRANAIDKAHEVLTVHMQTHAGQAVDTPERLPLLLSRVGIGRCAVVYLYAQMRAWCEAHPGANDVAVDRQLAYLIERGRLSRGAQFLHSRAQLEQIVIALDTFRSRQINHSDALTSDGSSLGARIALDSTGLGPMKWGAQRLTIGNALFSSSKTVDQTKRIINPVSNPTDRKDSRHGIPTDKSPPPPVLDLCRVRETEQNEAQRATRFEQRVQDCCEQTVSDLPTRDLELAHGLGDAFKGAGIGAGDASLHAATLMQALHVALMAPGVKPDIDPARIVRTLRQLDPVSAFEKAYRGISQGQLLALSEQAAYAVLMHLATTPTGLDSFNALKRLGVEPLDGSENAGLSASECESLRVLMTAALFLNEATAHRPFRANLVELLNDARHQRNPAACAIVGICAQWAGDATTHAQHLWAINAVRNGLFSTEPDSPFMEIDARIRKAGQWADRASRPSRLARFLMPMIKKTPLRMLREGVFGADCDDSQAEPVVVDQVSRQTVISAFHRVIDHIQGASRLKLYGGGSVGGHTKGITTLFSQLATGLVFRVWADCRLGYSRQAGLELAMPPYNMELSLYSQCIKSGQVGGGVGVGPHWGFATLGCGLNAIPYGREVFSSSGATLRMLRLRGKEGVMKQRFKAMVQDVFAKPATEYLPGELLTMLLARYPELSVNQIGSLDEDRTAHEVSSDVTASVGPASFKAFASAGVGLNYQSAIRRRYEDANGSLQVERRYGGALMRAGAGARIGVRMQQPSQPDYLQGMVAGDVAAIGVEFLSQGRTIRHDTVRHNGRLLAVSFFEIEHQSFDDFKRSIVDAWESWVVSKAAQAKKTDLQAVSDELAAFLNMVRQHKTPMLTFAQRFELRVDVAARVDVLVSLQKLASRLQTECGRSSANRLTQQIDDILNEASSYMPTSFRVYDRSDSQKRSGVGLAFRLEATDSAEGVYATMRKM